MNIRIIGRRGIVEGRDDAVLDRGRHRSSRLSSMSSALSEDDEILGDPAELDAQLGE